MKKSDSVNIDEYYKYLDFIKMCASKDSVSIMHSHHIIPRHLGGLNNQGNLILLSVDDHIKAHILFSRCFDKNSYEYISNIRSAVFLKKHAIVDISIMEQFRESFVGELDPFYNSKHTDIVRKIISEKYIHILKGLTYDDVYMEKSDAIKKKISESLKKYYNNMSEKQKDEYYIKNKNRNNSGNSALSKNPASTPILVDGIRYECIKDAMNHFGYTYYQKLHKNHKIIKIIKIT